MSKRRLSILIMAALSAPAAASVAAEPSVSLDVPSQHQVNPQWCWLAVSEMIIQYYTGKAPPAQCQLLESLLGAPRGACCKFSDRCTRPGALEEIRQLIAHYSHRVSRIIGPPPDPRSVYNTLNQNRVIIAAIDNHTGGGHVVIVRGIRIDNGTVELLINDPMHDGPLIVGYTAFFSHWRKSVVVDSN